MDILTIDQAIEKYLHLVGTARSNLTAKSYRNALGAFKLSLAAHNVDSAVSFVSRLRESVLGTFLDYLKDYSPATERLYIQAVVGFYKYLQAEELAAFNIEKMSQIVKMRIRGIGTRMPQFPIQAIEKVISHYIQSQPSGDKLIYLRDRALILTLADTGLRIHEACKLRRGDIDWHEGRAVIIGKGDKQAVIRFTKRSTDALKEYLSARQAQDGSTGRALPSLALFSRHDQGSGGAITPISTHTGREIIRDRTIAVLGEQGGITPHSFRHYFVTRIMQVSGGNLKLAQGLARHKNIQTTQRYAHMSDDELDQGYYSVFEAA